MRRLGSSELAKDPVRELLDVVEVRQVEHLEIDPGGTLLREGADLVDDLGSGPGQTVGPQLVDLPTNGTSPTAQGRLVVAQHDDLGGRVHQLVGVPALPIANTVREAIETAWFESRALRIVYEKKAWELTPRLVRIRNPVFDRSITLLNCVDLETGSDRQFRLDKIKQATVLDPQPA